MSIFNNLNCIDEQIDIIFQSNMTYLFHEVTTYDISNICGYLLITTFKQNNNSSRNIIFLNKFR